MIADVDMFLNTDEFAEMVTYSGTGQQVKAVIDRRETMDSGNTFVHGGFSDWAAISVSKAELPDPQPGEVFADESGTSWEIARKVRDDPAMVTLECIANERPSLGR